MSKRPKGPELLSKYLTSNDVLDRELAKALDVDESYIGYLRRGTRTPGLKVAFGIAAQTDGAVPADSWL